MTTHVLIVNKNTFKKHLEYMFIGTGNGKPFQINNGQTPTDKLSPQQENAQCGMLADCCRMREGDLIIFYLQQSKNNEGGFFGLFRVTEAPFVNKSNDLYPGLTKSLQFRCFIEPENVYSKGVTEWEALDDIREIKSPCQMLWSLIYRKLKGNRGNTMITLYESDYLVNLLEIKNQKQALQGNSFTYDDKENVIIPSVSSSIDYNRALCNPINILPRLEYKYNKGNAHEAHLQAWITQNIGKNTSFDNAVFGVSKPHINWIGNEVSCGVGMQRMDIIASIKNKGDLLESLYVIELKSRKIEPADVNQMCRYIDWLSQYYIPNRKCRIYPVLLTQGYKRARRNVAYKGMIEKNAEELYSTYSKRVNLEHLKMVSYKLNNGGIVFEKI